ncbi:MAG: hypothetical protein ABSB73_11565 [Solirubrobacteraceae bacterium]
MSRVAVTLPPGHPHGDPDEPVTFAFRLGRIREGLDNVLVHTGETIPIDEFTQALVDQALADYPGCQVGVERLVMDTDGSDSAQWIPTSEFDAEQHTPAGAGAARATTVHVTSSQAVA